LRLLSDLVSRPSVLDGKTTEDEVRKDILELQEETKKVKSYVDQCVAHHDRKPTTDIPLNKELTHAIQMLSGKFRKYYAILQITDIDLRTSHLEDQLAIFDSTMLGELSSRGTPSVVAHLHHHPIFRVQDREARLYPVRVETHSPTFDF
jgi:hypothetical protein